MSLEFTIAILIEEREKREREKREREASSSQKLHPYQQVDPKTTNPSVFPNVTNTDPGYRSDSDYPGAVR